MPDFKIVISSGYFNPLHAGHVEYFRMADDLGDFHIVILNNDEQAIKKKGKIIIPIEDRRAILSSIRYIDEVFISIDKDESVCKSIEEVVRINREIDKTYGRESQYIFAKGGDRFAHETPESKLCHDLGIRLIDGLGAKIQSSSNLIKNIVS